MAEEAGLEKTEEPTPRRREEARQQGQLALSAELNSSLVLLAGLLVLWFGSQALGTGLLSILRRYVLGSASFQVTPESVPSLTSGFLIDGLQLISPMLVILLLVGALAGILQAGFYIAPEAITFKPERLSPVEGFGRLFSLQGGLRALTSILKMVAVVGIAWWILAPQLGTVAALGQGALSHSASEGWSLVLRVSLAIAGGLLVAGVIDYGFQWFRLERSLRMTRQELKEEIKREEGDPLIKGRIRRLQREAAQRRMLSEVPRSTVVITNPVHLAIALRYESGVTAAPRVVAKGAGRIAEEIVKRARANGVPVLERPELARVLFRAVPIDRDVPAGLYVAVAEILAYIYRIRGRRG